MALLTLALVYRATRDWFDEEAALLAVAVLAWNPVFVTYAKQPMSDVPATAWVTLAIVLAMQRGASSAFGAGLAAGAAVITRPALLIAAATIPFLSLRGEARYRRFVLSGLGAAIGVAIQMAIQAKLFGSPFVTGYGSARGRVHLGARADQPGDLRQADLAGVRTDLADGNGEPAWSSARPISGGAC